MNFRLIGMTLIGVILTIFCRRNYHDAGYVNAIFIAVVYIIYCFITKDKSRCILENIFFTHAILFLIYILFFSNKPFESEESIYLVASVWKGVEFLFKKLRDLNNI